jgi:hypothetical protein
MNNMNEMSTKNSMQEKQSTGLTGGVAYSENVQDADELQ